MKAESMAIMTN